MSRKTSNKPSKVLMASGAKSFDRCKCGNMKFKKYTLCSMCRGDIKKADNG